MEIEDEAALAEHLDRELRYYERDKLSCRLKVCCMLQLVRARHTSAHTLAHGPALLEL